MLAGYEVKEFDVCTICYPICSGLPSFDEEMPCHTRHNDVSLAARYSYDDESDVHRCRRFRQLKGRP